jgi:hypothetical protein
MNARKYLHEIGCDESVDGGEEILNYDNGGGRRVLTSSFKYFLRPLMK